MEENTLDSFEVSFPEAEEQAGQTKNYAPVPEGLYPVEVVEVRFKQHKRGPMFGIRMDIQEGEHQNRVLWGNIIFLPYYADKAKKKVTPGAGIARTFLKAIGQPYKGEKIKVDPQSWRGKQLGVRVIVKNERNDIKAFYNGKDFAAAVEKASKVETLPEEAIF